MTDQNDLKVWAHGPLNGNIDIISNNKVQFEVENLEKNTMLETRVVTQANIFSDNSKYNSTK